MSFRKCLLFVLGLHVGFHTCWQCLWNVTARGNFIFLPVVSWYHVNVLGFIGRSYLESIDKAFLAGFLVFFLTGTISGVIIWALRPKTVLMVLLPTVFSLLLCLGILFGASHYMLPLYFASEKALVEEMGTEYDILQWVATSLKIKYYIPNPKAPPYLREKGSVTPLDDLRGVLSNESMQRVFAGRYSYCNLAPDKWSKLRDHGVTRCLVVWGRPRNAGGKRPVIVAELRTDVFDHFLMDGDEFRRTLLNMEGVLREETGDDSISLFNESERNR